MNYQKHVGKYKVHNKAKYVADLQGSCVQIIMGAQVHEVS